MSLVLLLVVLAVIGGIAVVATGRGGSLPDPDPDRATTGTLADDEVDRAHVDGLRFSLALRGYRMDEVDEVLDRLVDELDRRGERIRELEGQTGDGGTTAAGPTGGPVAEPSAGSSVDQPDPAGPTAPRDS